MTKGRIPIITDYEPTDLVHLKVDPYGGDPWSKATPTRNFFEYGRSLARGNYACDQVQRHDCAGGDWTTALDLSDGPMMVNTLWMACETTDVQAQDWRIRITFDGAGAPQIDTTGARISSMFGGGWYETPTFRARFNGVTINDGTHYSGYFRVPMPYQSSIKIEVYNPDDTVEHCWIMLERVSLSDAIIQNGPPRDMHLYNEYVSASIAWLDEQVLLDVAGPAILVEINHLLADAGGAAWAFLEGDYRIYYGDEVTASYRSSSAEDFYRSSFYFNEGTFANDDIVLSVRDAILYRVALQRFFRIEEAPCDADNLKLTWTNGDAGGGGNAVSSGSIWYYK